MNDEECFYTPIFMQKLSTSKSCRVEQDADGNLSRVA